MSVHCRFLSIVTVFSFLLFVPPAAASLPAVYIAQTAGGANTGADCANASPASFFNTAGSWGNGAAQIGAGTVVHLCGAWTGAANSVLLTFQGSGAPGSPIELLFEAGASLQAPYFKSGYGTGTGGAINLNGKSNLIIDGGATCGEVGGSPVNVSNCNGVIQNTANGTVLTYQLGSSAIYSSGSPHNVEIRNLVIKNMYLRVDPQNNSAAADGGGVYGIYFDHADFSGLNIHHNNIQNNARGTVLDFEGTNVSGVTIANNYVADAGWHISIAGYGNGTAVGNIQIHDNEITDWHNWLTPTGAFHSNGIMIFNSCLPTQTCSAGDTSSNIYNNYIHGDMTGGKPLYNSSGFISPQDNTSGFRIFNNRLHCTGGCQGMVYWLGCDFGGSRACGGNGQIYNNTMITEGGGNCVVVGTVTPSLIKNNIMVGCNGLETLLGDYTQIVSDYNVGYNLNTWAASASPYSAYNLAQWQAAKSKDRNSAASNPLFDASDRLQMGSLAIGLGTNLTSLGIAQLNKDMLGAARRGSGTWDAGAYQFTMVSPLAPPAGLTVTVH